MVAAIVLGILSGIAGFVPLVIGLRMARYVTRTSNLGHMGLLLLSLTTSFTVLFITLVICIKLARDVVLPFTLAEVLSLSVAAVGLGIVRLVRK